MSNCCWKLGDDDAQRKRCGKGRGREHIAVQSLLDDSTVSYRLRASLKVTISDNLWICCIQHKVIFLMDSGQWVGVSPCIYILCVLNLQALTAKRVPGVANLARMRSRTEFRKRVRLWRTNALPCKISIISGFVKEIQGGHSGCF